MCDIFSIPLTFFSAVCHGMISQLDRRVADGSLPPCPCGPGVSHFLCAVFAGNDTLLLHIFCIILLLCIHSHKKILCVCLTVCLCLSLSVCLSVCVSLFVCLSVCVSLTLTLSLSHTPLSHMQGVALEGSVCPLGPLSHPKAPAEFPLGCGVCSNLRAF